jgi:hypothetical protein
VGNERLCNCFLLVQLLWWLRLHGELQKEKDPADCRAGDRHDLSRTCCLLCMDPRTPGIGIQPVVPNTVACSRYQPAPFWCPFDRSAAAGLFELALTAGGLAGEKIRVLAGMSSAFP